MIEEIGCCYDASNFHLGGGVIEEIGCCYDVSNFHLGGGVIEEMRVLL